MGAEPDTSEGDEFERLADLINDYEDLHRLMGTHPEDARTERKERAVA